MQEVRHTELHEQLVHSILINVAVHCPTSFVSDTCFGEPMRNFTSLNRPESLNSTCLALFVIILLIASFSEIMYIVTK